MDKSVVTTNYIASLMTMLAGLSIHEFVALGGFLIGVATFGVNLWYKREMLKIQRKRSDDE